MTLLLVSLISTLTSTLGSFIALAAWFHFDLEGYWQHKKHDRLVRKGSRYEEKARNARISAAIAEPVFSDTSGYDNVVSMEDYVDSEDDDEDGA